VQIVDYCFSAAFLLALLWWGRYQRRVLVSELDEEAQAGLISGDESRLMSTYGMRLRLYWTLLRSGRLAELRILRHVHRQLAELAFVKWRLRRVGGDGSVVTRLRREIGVLRDAQRHLVGGYTHQ
jgi:hypothetical protein